MAITVTNERILDVEKELSELTKNYDLSISDEKMSAFASTLQHTDQSLRLEKLEIFIKSQLHEKAARWKTNFMGSLNKLNSFKDSLNEKLEKAKISLATLNTTISEYKQKIEKLTNDKYEIDNTLAKDGKSNHKVTVSLLLFIAFGLAIASGVKFYGISAKIAELNGEDINLINTIAFGLGSLAFIAGGKIVSIVYEKTNRNLKMFYIVATFAVVTTIAGIFSMAYSEKSQSAVSVAHAQYEEIRMFSDDDFMEEAEDNEEVNSISPIEKAKEALKKAEKELSDMQLYFTMLILFSELFIGSIAWMVLEDHTQTSSKKELENKRKLLEKMIDELENKIKIINEDKEILELKNNIEIYQDLISEIDFLLAHNKAIDEENLVSKSFEANEQNGILILNQLNIDLATK